MTLVQGKHNSADSTSSTLPKATHYWVEEKRKYDKRKIKSRFL